MEFEWINIEGVDDALSENLTVTTTPLMSFYTKKLNYGMPPGKASLMFLQIRKKL